MKFLPHQYVKYGQIGMGIALLICLVIIPRYFFSLDQGGVSNYGTEDKTRILFVIGFGLASLGTLLAAKSLKNKKTLQLNLVVLGLLYLLVLATTFSYKINDNYRSLHEKSAIVLFIFMLIFTLWLRFVVSKNNKIVNLWFWIFLLGIIVATLNFMGIVHLLFTAQIVSGAAFAVILVSSLKTTQKLL